MLLLSSLSPTAGMRLASIQVVDICFRLLLHCPEKYRHTNKQTRKIIFYIKDKQSYYAGIFSGEISNVLCMRTCALICDVHVMIPVTQKIYIQGVLFVCTFVCRTPRMMRDRCPCSADSLLVFSSAQTP